MSEQRMQFSIARLLLITLFVNFVLAATFALPFAVGFMILTFVSLFVIPPFVIVGAVHTRGIRQSFFLGAMVTGIPHFLVCVYCAVIVVFSFGDLSEMVDSTDEAAGVLRYIHAIGYLLGAVGGGCGMAAYAFYKFGEQPKHSTQTTLEPKSGLTFKYDRTQPDRALEFGTNDTQESFESEKREALPPR
jgi:hypothetical protein